MKKTYLLTTAFVFIAGVMTTFGQSNLGTSKAVTNDKISTEIVPSQLNNGQINYNSNRNIVWENDFSDPADWVLDNSGGAFGWEILDDQNPPSWAFDSRINSTSGGNYLHVWNDDPTVNTAQNATYHAILENPIDLTNFDFIMLTYETYGARFTDLLEVSVSIDDGATWTVVGDHEDIEQLTAGGGSATPNPLVRSYNISDAAGGQEEVWIRFSWSGDITYGWMIDDVAIEELPDYDLVLSQGNYRMYQGSWFATGGDWEADSVYFRTNSVIPESQVTGLNFRANILNFGATTQDVILTVDYDGTESNSAPTTLANDESSFFKVYNKEVGMPTIGEDYLFDIFANSTLPDYMTTLEETPANNYASNSPLFQVSENIMAIDNGLITGQYQLISQMSYLDQEETDPFGLEARYPMYADAELESVTVGFRRVDADDDGEWDLGGALINIYLQEIQIDGDISGGVIAEIENIVLEASDLPIDQDVFMDFEFDQNITLEEGKIYGIFVESLGGAPGLRFLRTGPSVGPLQVTIDLGDAGGGYVLSFAPVIRMNLVREVCQDLDLAITGDFEATATGGAEPYNYEWTDENGDVVDVSNPGDVPSGTYTVTVTDANDCTASEDVSWTSVYNHTNAHKINVFPNPANNVLNFDMNGVDARSIQIYDMTGKLVNTIDVRNSLETVNVNNLSEGLYIYKINDINGATIKTNKVSIIK